MNIKASVAEDAKCNLCDGPLKRGSSFYDASLPGIGWGWFCSMCARLHGVRLGTGLGQKYDSKTNEKLKG